MDHGRRDPGAVAAVFLVDVLDHLLAPLVLEIDVDVGRLLALLGNEALEQQVAGRRVDRGDPEAVADRAVRRRAAALAQDRRVETAREGDDVVDGQEVAREIEPLDQRQLVIQLLQHLVRNAVRPALLRAFPRQMLEMLLRRAPIGHRLPRIFVAQLVEAEVKRIRELPRRGDRMRPAREQPHHLRRRFQMPLGVGVQQIAGVGDGRLLADAGDDVLQRPAVGRVIMDVVGGEDRAAVGLRDAVQPLDPRIVVAAVKPARRDMAK